MLDCQTSSPLLLRTRLRLLLVFNALLARWVGFPISTTAWRLLGWEIDRLLLPPLSLTWGGSVVFLVWGSSKKWEIVVL